MGFLAKASKDPATIQDTKVGNQALDGPPTATSVVIVDESDLKGEAARGRGALTAALQTAVEAQQSTQGLLDGRTRLQAAIVQLGRAALASRDLNSTLDLLVREAGATLGLEFCSVQERGADGTTFLLRADFGCPRDASGNVAACVLGPAQAAFTLETPSPLIVADLRTETRFAVPRVELQYGAVSGMSVVIEGKQRAWGVVGAYAKTLRAFTEVDTYFLQAIANLMALAIERDAVETTLHHRNQQQAAVATLGRRALAGPHMDDLFADIVQELAATLGLEICEILQRDTDGRTLVLRAGVGWQPGLVGSVRVSSRKNTQAGFTLESEAPVVVTDLRSETRFEASTILLEHGVMSGMSVLVPGRNRPFGVLGVHSRSLRAFTQDDINFLQAVANLLAASVERHSAERELRRHRDDLEGLVEERTALLAASNRELEAFSYTISHDLRAPLRSINGLSKILQRKHGDALGPEGREMLQGVADETVRMSRLIESILALSRLGSVKLTNAPIDVTAEATSVLQTLQARDPNRTVAWTVEPGLAVFGDGGLLRLLLENLLGNAWKFTGQTQAARITVAHEVGGFRVEDNGAGFDMALARELFQPFHRLHSPEDFEGTGIGLATVSRIVGRHGGRVWAQSAPGQGATFRVTLPKSAPAEGSDVSAEPTAVASTHFNGNRVH